MAEAHNTKPSFWQVAREIVTDPGVGFSLTNTLLFAGMGGLALTSSAAALVTGITCKTLALYSPSALDKAPRLKKFLTDTRTPLHVNGLSLLTIAGASFALGAILPAVASLAFGISNFKIAENITHIERNGAVTPPSDFSKLNFQQKCAALTVRNLDFYISCGFAGAGLMAGGVGLIALPLIAVSYGISVHNTLTRRPEHHKHPKMIAAAAAAIFSLGGMTAERPLIALAQAGNACIYTRLESIITPGGFKQVMKDIGAGCKSILNFCFGKTAPKPILAPEPVSSPSHEEGPSPLSAKNLDAFGPSATAEKIVPPSGQKPPRPPSAPGSSEKPRA